MKVPHNEYHGVDNPNPDNIARDAEQYAGDSESMESTEPIIVHD